MSEEQRLSAEMIERAAEALFVDYMHRKPDRLDELRMETNRRRAMIVLKAARPESSANPPQGDVSGLVAALGRVREFVENEVDNRDAAGSLMSDYEGEAKEALAELDGVIASLGGGVPTADADPGEYPPPCSDPGGHVWVCHADNENVSYCEHCGADGNA